MTLVTRADPATIARLIQRCVRIAAENKEEWGEALTNVWFVSCQVKAKRGVVHDPSLQ